MEGQPPSMSLAKPWQAAGKQCAGSDVWEYVQASAEQVREGSGREGGARLLALPGHLVLARHDLHEVGAVGAPVLDERERAVRAHVAQRAAVQQAERHVLLVPRAHAVVHLRARGRAFISAVAP